MSFMCCVYLPEGIVMAADSRITQEDTVKKEVDGREYFTKTKYTLSDNGQKIFLRSQVRCGISFCGKVFIDGMTIADYLRQFEISQLDETDTVCTVAEKLLRYYGRSETMFFVAGYLNDEPLFMIFQTINVHEEIFAMNLSLIMHFGMGSKMLLQNC